MPAHGQTHDTDLASNTGQVGEEDTTTAASASLR